MLLEINERNTRQRGQKMRQSTQVMTNNERKEKRQSKTCQRIGRILRITIAMVTKSIILWVLLFGKASMEEVGRKRTKRHHVLFCRDDCTVIIAPLCFTDICGKHSSQPTKHQGRGGEGVSSWSEVKLRRRSKPPGAFSCTPSKDSERSRSSRASFCSRESPKSLPSAARCTWLLCPSAQLDFWVYFL